MATTLKFLILGDDQASRAFDRFAGSVDGATVATDRSSAALKGQAKTAAVSADATLALAKSDKILRDAALELEVAEGRLTRAQAEQALAADEARSQLEKEGRAAEVAAAKLRLSGGAAEKAGLGLGSLAQYTMPALIGAGVALSPVIATVGLGLGGLGAAAYGTVSPILQASQAAGGLQANLKTLSPVQQQMARELLGLEGTASAFSRSLQPQVVKLWGDGLSIAGGILHDIQPVARATGDALHGVLGSINATLDDSQWRGFFQFMAQNAGPDVKLLGDNLVTFIGLLPPLLTDLQPVAVALLTVTDAGGKLLTTFVQLENISFPWLKEASSHSDALAGIFRQVEAGSLPWLQFQKQAATGGDALARSVAAAAAATANLGRSVTVAAPKVGTLSGDMAILATTTSQSQLALQAYSDEWAIFVGNSVGDQQAVLNVTQAFESFSKTVKQSGRTSTAAQQAFLSIFTTIGSGLDALHKNGASVSQLNDFYTTAISRLGHLHNLTPQQRADVQGLTKDYVAWANSVTGLSGNTVRAAGVIRQDWLTALSATHQLAPSAKADADNLAASILKTGTNSRATAADRAKLITDLEKSGLSAMQARADVIGFQDRINSLRGKTVNVGLTTSGSGEIIIRGTGINQRVINTTTGQLRAVGGHTLAAGGRVPGFGGGDIWPALLEPGEAVVDKHTTRRHAGVLKAMGVPGFAAGGVVGRVSAAEAGIGSAEALWGSLSAQAFAQSAVKAAQAAMPGAFPGGPLSASAAAAQAFARSQLAGWGWGPGQWPPLQALWQRESGWNSYAVNPSSGAYGIPQSLGHGHPYSLGDYMAQVRWGLAYITSRYGSPAAAWAHELAFNWYDSGGVLKPGVTLAVNGTGRDEYVSRTPPRGGNTYSITVNVPPGVHPAQAAKPVIEAIKEYERVNGAGWRS